MVGKVGSTNKVSSEVKGMIAELVDERIDQPLEERLENLSDKLIIVRTYIQLMRFVVPTMRINRCIPVIGR